MRGAAVALTIALALGAAAARASGAERPCNQNPPSSAPTYTEPYGNRFYAGSTTGVWGNSDWYLYADADSGTVQGRGTIDNLGGYFGADRRCLVAFGYPIVGAVASTPDQGTRAGAESCDDASWTAGVVDICDGELVYRDYVYDDYGADTGEAASTTGTLSQPRGDVRYPAADTNSADLVALRLRLDGGRLRVRFELSSLFRADSTAGAIAIDADNDRSTGGGEWTGASQPPVSSDGFDVLGVFGDGDPGANVTEGDMALPPGEVWRVQALTAQAGGPVMNVAFRGTGEGGTWWEDNQATALVNGDVSPFGFTVNVDDLRPGVTRLQHVGPGVFERVYTSAYTVAPGEGVSYAGVPGRTAGGGYFDQEFHFLGRHQPYAVYVPDKPAPHGLQLVLHGFSANHSSLVRQAGFREDVGDARNRVLVSPLGRGPAGFYSDWSERDVLDALDDATAHFDVDLSRVFVSGYSMGGYGAYRMAMLHPDRFAGFISWVGGTGDAFNGTPRAGTSAGGSIGNVLQMVRNVRHVPGAMLYGAADELVWATGATAMAQAFAAEANPYIFYMHPAAEHFTFALADNWVKESGYTQDLSLVRDPARVTFRTREDLGNAALDIRHDRAYWVSDIRQRESRYADVDLTTACGSLPSTQATQGAGPSPVPWVSQGAAVTGQQLVQQDVSLKGTLINVATLTLDAEDACLGTYRIETDGPVTITLTDGRSASLPSAGTFNGEFI